MIVDVDRAIMSRFSDWPPESNACSISEETLMVAIKWLIALAIVPLLACAANDAHCRNVVCEKTMEGLAGGLLVALALAFSTIEKLRGRKSLPARHFARVVQREACVGLVGGLLVGLALAVVILAAG
jgi:hypothetical protein